MKAPTESALVTACLQLLRLRGVLCWRANQGAIPSGKGGYRRFAGLPGVADVLAVLPPSGRLLAVECKSLTGRQSPAQLAFQAAVERAGGVYLLMRDLRELLAVLDDAALV
jgi:hypothetical protein